MHGMFFLVIPTNGGIQKFLPLVVMTSLLHRLFSLSCRRRRHLKIPPVARNDKLMQGMFFLVIPTNGGIQKFLPLVVMTSLLHRLFSLSCRRRRHLKIPPVGRNDKLMQGMFFLVIPTNRGIQRFLPLLGMTNLVHLLFFLSCRRMEAS